MLSDLANEQPTQVPHQDLINLLDEFDHTETKETSETQHTEEDEGLGDRGESGSNSEIEPEKEKENYSTHSERASDNCSTSGKVASENSTAPDVDTSENSVPPLGDYDIYESDNSSSDNCKNRYSNENECDCEKCWNYVRTANHIYSRLEIHKPGPCATGLKCCDAIKVAGLVLPTEEEMASLKSDHSCGITKNKMIASNVIRGSELSMATMLIPSHLRIHMYKTECHEFVIEII